MLQGWQHLSEADRAAVLRGIADGHVYGGPYHLELDWVDRCNARCFFCNSEQLQKGQTMPWERARALLEDARSMGLRSIRLAGGGEPTLHRNLPDLLGWLARHDIILDNLTTNGVLLGPDVIERLMAVRVVDVRVSLNYCDADNWGAGMGLTPSSFERVTEGMRRLHGARQGNPHFGRLLTQFFVYRPTASQIVQMYRLGRELGADVITFRELDAVDPKLVFTPEQVPEIASQMRAIIAEDWGEGRVESHLASHGIGAQIAKIYDEIHAEKRGERPPFAPRPAAIDFSNRYCYIGWYSMTIMGNQAVYPCCFLLPASDIVPMRISLEGRSLHEVWHGPELTRFRREMRRWMLQREPAALFHRRVKTMMPGCQTHGECPFSAHLADPAFYEQADRVLDPLRRRPLTRLAHLVNHTALTLERRLRK